MDFNKILDVKMDAVERPPLPPIGHYVFQVKKVPEINQKEGAQWSSINFQCAAIEVYEDADDVDADDLKKFGGAKNVFSRYSFMFDSEDETQQARSKFALKTFLEDHLGIDPALTLKAALNAAVNKRFVGKLRHRADKQNAENIYAEIEKTAKLED